MVALALSASSMRLMTFSPSPRARRFSRSRHDQPGGLPVGHVQVEPVQATLFRFLPGSDSRSGLFGHRWVGTSLRITLGPGRRTRVSPYPVRWPVGQERSGQLLTIRATKPDKNPPSGRRARSAQPRRRTRSDTCLAHRCHLDDADAVTSAAADVESPAEPRLPQNPTIRNNYGTGAV